MNAGKSISHKRASGPCCPCPPPPPYPSPDPPSPSRNTSGRRPLTRRITSRTSFGVMPHGAPCFEVKHGLETGGGVVFDLEPVTRPGFRLVSLVLKPPVCTHCMDIRYVYKGSGLYRCSRRSSRAAPLTGSLTGLLVDCPVSLPDVCVPSFANFGSQHQTQRHEGVPNVCWSGVFTLPFESCPDSSDTMGVTARPSAHTSIQQ